MFLTSYVCRVFAYFALVVSFFWALSAPCQEPARNAPDASLETDLKKNLERLNNATIFFEFLQAQKLVLDTVAIGREKGYSFSRLPAGVECQLFWQRIKGQLAELPTDDRQIDGLLHWSEFFGYLHGKLGVAPPGDWRHYVIYRRFPDDRDGVTASLKNEEEVMFAYDNDQINIRGGNSYYSTRISRQSPEGRVQWRAEVFPLENVEDVSRLTGPMSVIRLVSASLEPELDQLTIWGADSRRYCFMIKFSFSTGKKLDQCYFDTRFPD